jgi:hypothetical protein
MLVGSKNPGGITAAITDRQLKFEYISKKIGRKKKLHNIDVDKATRKICEIIGLI